MPTNTATYTDTYSTIDVENVFRRFGADLRMVAQSSRAMERSEIDQYIADITLLATEECISAVDVSLLSYGIEQKATRYTVDTESGDLTNSRPGGVIWPAVNGASLRIAIFYTPKGQLAKQNGTYVSRLKISWGPCLDDLSHADLTQNGTRSYSSTGYGLSRQDYSR
jgi:hypothetical protein